MHNFTYVIEHLWDWSTTPYEIAVGFLFYPILFSGILGYLYLKTESALVLTVGILLLIGGYATTGIYADVQPWVLFLQIVATLSTIGLIILFVSRWRR
jgi:hypothetical protein